MDIKNSKAVALHVVVFKSIKFCHNFIKLLRFVGLELHLLSVQELRLTSYFFRLST